VGQWSPDARSVAYVAQTADSLVAYYARAVGEQGAVEILRVPDGMYLDVGWLPDGRPVAITLGLGPVGGFEASLQAYDPTTGTTAWIASDSDLIQPWTPWRSPDGTQQIYATTTWEESRYRGACRSGPLALVGDLWLPVAILGGEADPQIAFAMEGMFMDRPFWLDDGRIIFRAIADPVCTSLESGLYIATIGGEPVQLVAAEPDYTADESDKVLWSTSFAVSPDQAQIAWTENDDTRQRALIHVMPLDGGPVATLFASPPIADDAIPFTFRDREMILYFIWLPG